ncbi:hypothetical protein VDGD_20061 [Verticillium dahliae]|nr:hypothetical protein VDGD_20061 [Verticillium dahliae]
MMELTLRQVDAVSIGELKVTGPQDVVALEEGRFLQAVGEVMSASGRAKAMVVAAKRPGRRMDWKCIAERS